VRFRVSKNTVVALICSQAIICLPRTQKPVSKCYVIERFMGTIVEWYEYCPLPVLPTGLNVRTVARKSSIGGLYVHAGALGIQI